MKLAMIGGKASTAGFRALGLETFAVSSPSEAPDAWRRLDPYEFAVIFITEPVYETLKEETEALQGPGQPVILVIPAVEGSKGLGYEEIRVTVERAVGTDLMFQE
jgi:V/A-type H+-transporting ATPase subunit F